MGDTEKRVTTREWFRGMGRPIVDGTEYGQALDDVLTGLGEMIDSREGWNASGARAEMENSLGLRVVQAAMREDIRHATDLQRALWEVQDEKKARLASYEDAERRAVRGVQRVLAVAVELAGGCEPGKAVAELRAMHNAAEVRRLTDSREPAPNLYQLLPEMAELQGLGTVRLRPDDTLRHGAVYAVALAEMMPSGSGPKMNSAGNIVIGHPETFERARVYVRGALGRELSDDELALTLWSWARTSGRPGLVDGWRCDCTIGNECERCANRQERDTR